MLHYVQWSKRSWKWGEDLQSNRTKDGNAEEVTQQNKGIGESIRVHKPTIYKIPSMSQQDKDNADKNKEYDGDEEGDKMDVNKVKMISLQTNADGKLSDEIQLLFSLVKETDVTKIEKGV